MRGVVAQIVAGGGKVAVQTEDGYSILEVITGDVDPGDVLSWDDATAQGREPVRNLTSGETLDVAFENHHVSESNLPGQLGL